MTITDDIKHFTLDVGRIAKNALCLALALGCLAGIYFQLFDGVKPRHDYTILPLVILGSVMILSLAAFDLQFLKFIVGGGVSVVTTIVTSVRAAKGGGTDVTTTVTTADPATTQPPKRRTMLAAAMSTGMAKALPPKPPTGDV